jgi:CheY-like chemotaxis protein
MPRALIIDDSAAFRASARSLLEAEGFAVTEAATAADGIDAARAHAPDVVLLDVQLPDLDGFEAARRLARLRPPPPVVLTSTRDAADFGSLIGESAARGFVPKSELSGETILALIGGGVSR